MLLVDIEFHKSPTLVNFDIYFNEYNVMTPYSTVDIDSHNSLQYLFYKQRERERERERESFISLSYGNICYRLSRDILPKRLK